MVKRLDLKGKKFGKLLVKDLHSSKPVKWGCICDCGNTKVLLSNNLTKSRRPSRSCGCAKLSDNTVEVGKEFKTQSCGVLKIVELLGGQDVLCEFSDGTQVVASKGNIRSGMVKNYNQPLAYEKGYHGIGPHRAHNEKAHQYWFKMLQRAYCPIYKKDHPTYEGVYVCEEWLNYQNFAEWVKSRKQYGRKGFNLDKDIIKPGNKVYCPEFCSLVPQHINKVTVHKSLERDIPRGVVKEGNKYVSRCKSFDGKETYLGIFESAIEAGEAYKRFKKSVIIETAEHFQEDLDDAVYKALLNFTVLD